MVLTPSTMLALGTPAPEFSLPDVLTGKTVRLADFSGKKALLVLFICRHCPYVKHLEGELARFANEFLESGLASVAISSNDAAGYPDDAPASLAEQARFLGFRFPYLHDASQAAAKAYTAACTPDLFLFDAARKLVYRGQFDDSRPGNGKPVTGTDLRKAVESVLAGRAPEGPQRPSIGCNIKWIKGQEPAYFGSA